VEILRSKIGVIGIPVLDERDEKEIEKIGSYSIMKPSSERLPSLMEYGHASFDPDMGSLKRAFDTICRDMPAHSVRPWSLESAYKQVYRDSENLGLPYLTKDKSYLNYYLEVARKILTPEEFDPAMWYWRGTATGPSEAPKQRDVWGVPHYETILGQTIYKPWLSVISNREGHAAWVGDWKVDDAMTRILKKANGRPVYSLDQKSFDKKLSYEMLMMARDYMEHCLSTSVSERIWLLAEVGATLSIVVPYDVVHQNRKGGMMSGRVGTNPEDTELNRMACWYCAYRDGTTIEDGEWMGDDAVVLFKDPIDPDDLAVYMSELGLECNPDKQFISSTAVHYLQRVHTLDYQIDGRCVGVRSPYRALNSMMSYERLKKGWNKYMDTARWIMQVENTKHDPRFVEVVKFLKEGDKVLSSGMDPASVFKAAGGADEVRSTLGIASFPFNIQNPEKVNEFNTTRVLRTLN
jgi:hypothetical protein